MRLSGVSFSDSTVDVTNKFRNREVKVGVEVRSREIWMLHHAHLVHCKFCISAKLCDGFAIGQIFEHIRAYHCRLLCAIAILYAGFANVLTVR